MRNGVLMMALCAATAGAGGTRPNTGPWDLAALRRPPEVEWVRKSGVVRPLYYAGEPFGGKPTRVFAYYGVPAKRQGRAPAMVLVHGGGGKAFPQWAEMWARRGYAALTMDLSGIGPDGTRQPDGMPDQGHDDKFTTLAKGLKETWPYHAVAAVIRGASLLAAQPEVDADRIGVTGISWGGYLTCIVAGLDRRLKLAIPVYGCGYLLHNSAWVDILNGLPAAERTLWMDNFDPSAYLPQAAMPILWVNGTNDGAYPLDSYRKSYRTPPGPRTLCVTVRMAHGHEPGWSPVEIGLFADHHLCGGKPLPRLSPTTVGQGAIEASFEAAVPIKKAALHYTTDTVTWNEREWETADAELADGKVRATLPCARPIAFFLTLTDQRGATVSTEHQELR